MIKNLLLLTLALAGLYGFSFFNGPSGGPETPSAPPFVFYAKNGNPNWLKPREGVRLKPEDVLQKHAGELGLGARDELRLYRTLADELGMIHYRYELFHRGVKVQDAEVFIHERNGVVESLNGHWPRGLDAGVEPAISAEEAIALALQYMPATTYIWEVEAAEQMLQKVRRDKKATFLPEAELVLIDPSLEQAAQDYHLAYTLTVHAKEPVEERKQLFIDANTGELLLKLEQLFDNDHTGIAETKYSGTREIITDSIASNRFRLIETGRGGGIETYDLNTSSNENNSVDFTDDDNYWNNVNPQQDEAATDAHWGAEMTFDYFAQVHNYTGIDGENMPLISYVHYSENWVNAQWTGNWARFGDGNGTSYSSMAALDIVAHEFGHGITQFNAGLIYQDESGALNESFSDIFGAAVEFWASPELSDWNMGEDANINGNGLRDMSNPKSKGDPDTYRGQNWINSGEDNGGVHTNSGVQNYWFHLLADGGSGSNDNGDGYDVQGVGVDTAAAIAFRNLRYYLGRRSEYFDARLGSLQAAEDLYGICSQAVVETTKAWYAVGIGPETSDFDLRLLEILSPAPIECGFGEAETITLQFRYNGCSEQLEAGFQIPMAFQVDGGAVRWDTLTLPSALTGGDTLTFTYAIPAAELALPAVHQLRCWAGLEADVASFNDTLELTVDNILEQNVDLGLGDILSPFSGCFLDQSSLPVQVQFGFFGCDSLPAGETLEVSYRLNNGAVVSESATLPNTLYRGDFFNYTFNNQALLPVSVGNELDAWITYSPDYLMGNDTIMGRVVSNPIPVTNPGKVTFEGGMLALDSIYTTLAKEGNVFLSEDAARTGSYGIQMTGGDFISARQRGETVNPEEDNVWEVNEQFSAKVCFCADLTNLAAASLRFDLRQTYTTYYLTGFGSVRPLGSPLRVLVNGEQASETYKPGTFSSDLWKTHRIELADYLGSRVEVCFETRNGFSKEFDPSNKGDNAYIDNIVIGDLALGTDGEASANRPIRLFPNPARQNIRMDIPHSWEVQAIEVYNQLGERVMAVPVEERVIHASFLPAGLYFIRVKAEGREWVEKVVVQ